MNLNNILKIDYGQCPPDCNACEEACASIKENRIGLIKSLHIPEVEFDGAVTCLQCGVPMCRDICPSGAISKNEENGVVIIDEERCVGCGLCTIACPYGGIYYDPVARTAAKCDLCEGDPKCVSACEYGVLTFQRMQDTLQYLGKDLASHGTTLCQGCGAEQLLRFSLRAMGEDIIVFGGPGCGATLFAGTDAGAFRPGPSFITFMTNMPSTAAGVKRYYDRIGKDVTCVCLAGDGLTADVGFQPLSGAAERGEKIIYICYDNEAYMNTGIQRSSTTPFMGRTTTTPVGKKSQGKQQTPKNVPLLMAFHDGVSYVATATLSHLEDLAKKLERAKEMVKDGMVYIHLFAPCPTGWASPTDTSVTLAKLAVETNYFPLWEAENRDFRFTCRVKHPRPVQEFTRLMGRFRHLNEEDMIPMQKWVNYRMKLIESLVELDGGIKKDFLDDFPGFQLEGGV